MQTNQIKKWAALLLTFSGMAALPLTVSAQPILNPAENINLTTGGTYSVLANRIIYSIRDGATHTGTNVLLFGGTSVSGIVLNGTNTKFYGSNVTVYTGIQLDAQGNALNAGGAITTDPSQFVWLNTPGSGNPGLSIAQSSTGCYVEIDGLKIVSNGINNNVGGAIIDSGTAVLRNVDIEAVKSNGAGLMVRYGAVVEVSSGTIISQNATALAVADAVFIGSNLVISGSGNGLRQSGGTVTLIDSTISSVSSAVYGISDGLTGGATFRAVNVQAQGVMGIAFFYRNGSGEMGNIIIEGGSLDSTGPTMSLYDGIGPGMSGTISFDHTVITNQGDLIFAGGGHEFEVNFKDMDAAGTITGIDTVVLEVNLDNTSLTSNSDAQDNSTIIISGSNGTVITGTIIGSGSSNTIVNLDNSTLNGGSNAGDDSSITINGTNSIIIGDITGSGSSNTNVNLDNSSVTGDVSASDDATINISGSKGSSITGDINSKDNGTIIIDLDDSKYNGGDINSSGSSNITISGSNGSSVTGTANSKDDSTITINIDGPGSSWIGDTNQDGDSKIIININNGGSGTGGFNGGDLNVGKDSEFTFDKDSHGNNGKNDGTWNIGDKDVTFDNMDNNGKIIIDINSDDQSHGSFDVTGTASGTGTIKPNVTGTTAASQEDQDRILNDLVKGNGKGVWDMEDFDWGLIVISPTTAPDGSIYTRPDGKLSAAGNIAVGLIAAQKSSWFAQQNSLLKRMGELRLLNDAHTQTVTVSGKEDKDVAAPMLSADKLLENVWIRAYGQQLNYGTNVTGQSFKQYVYGTDLGTDHKFTLNNSNALFTGIFAGYGAADTDHRHYGSKSDISNYYAGLYASWLHTDGWYADATLKAQYSDHNLSGWANGLNYFSGKYHNWSVGGSIELGKQIKFKNDWFVEPQLQANYLHILADDYTLSDGLNVDVSELDALQLRFGIVTGKTFKLKNGGALQPYVKISGVEMVSTGGKISAMGNNVRPNLDGARAELGAGIIWQLDAHNQLHLDYEASFGDKYDKPWGLTAGYRYQF